MNTIFIMSFLEGVPELGFSQSGGNNQHVTFLAHVLIPDEKDIPLLIQEVAKLTKEAAPFSLAGGNVASFGVNNNFTVLALDDNTHGAASLHKELLAISQDLKLQIAEPYFAGENFVPHITFNPEQDSPEELNYLINSLTIVNHHDDFGSENVEVLANFIF